MDYHCYNPFLLCAACSPSMNLEINAARRDQQHHLPAPSQEMGTLLKQRDENTHRSVPLLAHAFQGTEFCYCSK